MRTLLTVMMRELRSYFYSPIAYSVIFIFTLVAGFFFYSGMAMYGVTSFEMTRMAQMMPTQELSLSDFVIRPTFGNISVVMLLMMPLLTMRLFSEEKKSGSIELLFTWPIRDIELVLGKYFAALIVLAIAIGLTTVHVAIVGVYAPVPWGEFAASYLGLFLLGASFISLGLFVSTLTENQIISAILSFGALLIFWLGAWTMGQKRGLFPEVMKYISIIEHQDPFFKGVIDTMHLVYYFSFIFLFLFLALRSLETNKWRS
ncbi:Gliding motility-associated ABC transporter permease protein GldF [hydrothermal vent metagenome]|uniref:Gliding motility-associated ABC transporter permease protein GldF n=1 Tax=hydrothermal vent metagenome TaxID=652676 RepID=A0A3B1CC32_9ZZZZ